MEVLADENDISNNEGAVKGSKGSQDLQGMQGYYGSILVQGCYIVIER